MKLMMVVRSRVKKEELFSWFTDVCKEASLGKRRLKVVMVVANASILNGIGKFMEPFIRNYLPIFKVKQGIRKYTNVVS